MRALVATVVLCVLAMAGAVLYVSESERSTAETNFQEARTADQLRVLILDEVRGVDGYLESGEQFFLTAYTTERAELRRRLAEARELCSDDGTELRLIGRMTAAHRDLNRLADKAIAEKRGGTLRTDHFLTQGQGNLDLQVFLDANSGFGAR